MKSDEIYDAGEFIPNNQPQYKINELWKEEEEDGFDVYIDSLLNLPDNVSLCKIKAKIVNC